MILFIPDFKCWNKNSGAVSRLIKKELWWTGLKAVDNFDELVTTKDRIKKCLPNEIIVSLKRRRNHTTNITIEETEDLGFIGVELRTINSGWITGKELEDPMELLSNIREEKDQRR